LGPKSNWKMELLELINKKFGCEATNIRFIWTYKRTYKELDQWWDLS
jgi:hypothetical protein